MSDKFVELVRQTIDEAVDAALLEEYPCWICGLPRLLDDRDHHTCRYNPAYHELHGLRGFINPEIDMPRLPFPVERSELVPPDTMYVLNYDFIRFETHAIDWYMEPYPTAAPDGALTWDGDEIHGKLVWTGELKEKRDGDD